MKLIHALTALAITTAITGNAFAAINNGGGLGASDDCYNRVSRACAVAWPGGDLGNAGYKKCIEDGMNNCDKNEPALSLLVKPGLLATGNLTVLQPKPIAPTVTLQQKKNVAPTLGIRR